MIKYIIAILHGKLDEISGTIKSTKWQFITSKHHNQTKSYDIF